jgi:hypothetical protein
MQGLHRQAKAHTFKHKKVPCPGLSSCQKTPSWPLAGAVEYKVVWVASEANSPSQLACCLPHVQALAMLLLKLGQVPYASCRRWLLAGCFVPRSRGISPSSRSATFSFSLETPEHIAYKDSAYVVASPPPPHRSLHATPATCIVR